MIRKQAMRNVADERRRRPKKPRKGLRKQRSEVAYQDEGEGEGEAEEEVLLEVVSTASPRSSITIAPGPVRAADSGFLSPPLSLIQSPSPDPDYEMARTRFAMDITELSIFTNWTVNQTSAAVMVAEPIRLIQLLGIQAWSFLDYVPARYASSPVLSAATDCVLAKVNASLLPRPDQDVQRTCRRLYGKTLKLLQDAIADPDESLQADVLCATQLLAIHELLDVSRGGSWQCHVEGAARLIRHRSPSNFQTDYEKALLASHIGASTTQSLFGNRHCYLEDEQWVSTYMSLIKNETALTERSSLTIKLRKAMILCPGLWHDVDTAIKSESNFDTDELQKLRVRCAGLEHDLLDWMDEYKTHCVDTSLKRMTMSELDLRRELLGTAHEALCLVKRLLASVDEDRRCTIEEDIQSLACKIMELQEGHSARHSWLFTDVEVGVAFSVMQTKDQWLENAYDDFVETRLAARTRYCRWNGLLRAS